VRPTLVVVAAVDAEDALEMAAAEDQDPVEAVGPDSANPALRKRVRVRVRVRSLNRRPDDLDALAAEDLVEGVAEPAVAIVDEESERLLVAELHEKVACLLGRPVAVRVGVQARYSIRLVASEMKKRM
jgi:hypothetical protein